MNIKNIIKDTWLGISFFLTISFWSILIIILGALNYKQQISSTYDILRAVALDSFNKDLLFREWATVHGGVYVPISQSTPPNKYLSHIPERDIETPSGKKLTLINPAYMNRQIYELSRKKYDTRGHITSLNPIRPENAPDEWEKKSLQSFEMGKIEADTIALYDGQEFFRLMRPMITQAGCLSCHAKQGYKVGDIRGGISVSIPYKPFREASKAQIRINLTGFAGIWLIGLIGLIFIRRDTKKHLSVRKLAEERITSLLNEKEILLKEVHHRIKNNMNSIKGLLYLQAESIKEPSAIYALKDAEKRVASMMLLYDKLYRSENFREISIKKYIPALIDEIAADYPAGASVKIDVRIDDFILDINKLQTLGIIVNELFTNIMKYAFRDRNEGLIEISALKIEDQVIVEIQDNGIGIPESVDFNSPIGFGMQLVYMLTQQIGGTIRIERNSGTKFVLEFKI